MCLREFRDNCRILIAVGACAINGGVPAMRNHFSLRECLEESFLHGVGVDHRQIPDDVELPLLLDEVHPIHEVVHIDYYLPGCPPSADESSACSATCWLAGSPRSPKNSSTTTEGNLPWTRTKHHHQSRASRPDSGALPSIRSRVEGHGKVNCCSMPHHVHEARLHIVEFRGFEKFIQGRPYWEVPFFVQRLCGICRSVINWRRPRRWTNWPASNSLHRRRSNCAACCIRPDPAIACAAFFPPVLARPAVRFRQRSGAAQHRRRAGQISRPRDEGRETAQVRTAGHRGDLRQTHPRHGHSAGRHEQGSFCRGAAMRCGGHRTYPAWCHDAVALNEQSIPHIPSIAALPRYAAIFSAWSAAAESGRIITAVCATVGKRCGDI